MARWLKQSTAFTFRIGPFVDDTDFKTAETALSIGQADIQISKNGGAFAQTSATTPTTTHDTDGWYQCPLTTTDTNTLGPLTVQIVMAGALAVWEHFVVVPANVYDSVVSGSDNLQVDTTQIEGSDATDQINAACDTAIETYGLDHLLAASVAGTDVVDNSVIAKLVSSAATADWDTYNNTTDSLEQAQQDRNTIAGDISNLQIDVSAILVDTAEIGAAGAGLTAIPWNAAWDAEVESEVNDALVILHLDHLLAVDYDPAAKPGTSTALLNELVESDAGVSRFTANALEQAPAGGGDGSGFTAIPWNSAWDAEVESEVNDALVVLGLDHLVSTSVTGTDVADDSIFARIVSKTGPSDWDTFVNTTDSLQAIRDRGDVGWTTGTGGSNPFLVASGTIGATGNDTTHLHLSGLAYVDDAINDLLIIVTDVSAGLTYSTWITDWANTGDLATVDTLPFTPEASVDTYSVVGVRRNNYTISGTKTTLDALNDVAATDIVSSGAITTSGGAVSNVTTVATTTTNTDMRGTDSAALASVCTEARLSELDAGTGGKMANQVDVIEADTTALNDTKIPDTLSLANINAEVDTAIADVNLDHLVGTATGIPAVPAGTFLDQIMDDGTATFDRTTDSLQALRDHVGDGTNLTEAGGTGDHLTAVPWNAAWDAEVESEVNDALVALHLDHLLAVDYDPASKPGTATALLNELVESDAGVSRFTANALEQGPGGGGDGSGFTAIPWNSAWDAEVESEVNDALVAIGLDHLLSAAVVGTDVVDNSVIAKLVSSAATADWDTFVNTTDALQAIRDRGDAAWVTGGGGSITDILAVEPLIPESIDLANTATWRLGLKLFNALDDLPSTGEITPGTISIDRKAIGGTSWSAVVTDAACSEAAGIVYYDEVFDSGTGYAEGDSIRITFKSQKITVAANDYEIADATGFQFYTEIRQTMRGTDNALKPTVAGRTADVTAGGAVGIDWSNIENPSSTVGLSDTTVKAVTNRVTANSDQIEGSGALAQVKAMVQEVVKSDTTTELPQSAPADDAPLSDQIRWLYQYFRNLREQTATEIKMYDNAGTTVISKAAISDDGTTFTKEEFASGP